MSDTQDDQSTAIESLNEVKHLLEGARRDQRGKATDRSLEATIRAVTRLEGIVRTLVVGAAG